MNEGTGAIIFFVIVATVFLIGLHLDHKHEQALKQIDYNELYNYTIELENYTATLVTAVELCKSYVDGNYSAVEIFLDQLD